jgi:predicted DNA binding CopG/RHH family protein
MPTKDSTVRGVRISNLQISMIEQRANRKGWTFNKWMNWAIEQGLRPHRAKEGK